MADEQHVSLIFSWRRPFHRRFQLFFATLIVLPLAALVYYNTKINTISTASQEEKSAEFTLLPEMAVSRDDRIKMAQKTPFPDVVSSSEVERYAQLWLEKALRYEKNNNQELKEILPLRRQNVFSKSIHLPSWEKDLEGSSSLPEVAYLQPRMKLMTQEEMPQPETWPIFPFFVLKSEEQMFMIHINEKGSVDQCYPIERDTNKKIAGLENWLLSLRYMSGKSQPQGWFSCVVEWRTDSP